VVACTETRRIDFGFAEGKTDYSFVVVVVAAAAAEID
jgi:hypothetical protein